MSEDNKDTKKPEVRDLPPDKDPKGGGGLPKQSPKSGGPGTQPIPPAGE